MLRERANKEYPDNWGVKFYPNGETPEQALTRRLANGRREFRATQEEGGRPAREDA